MAQEPQLQGPFRFGVFELDPRSGELRKNGVKLRLQEQPLQVLLMLVERAGDVVTREELREKLWPDGTFVDFEKGVNTAIQKLRDVLGDSAVTPRLIETVPRRGYRFIYPVERPAGLVAVCASEGSGCAAARRGRCSPPRTVAPWARCVVDCRGRNPGGLDDAGFRHAGRLAPAKVLARV